MHSIGVYMKRKLSLVVCMFIFALALAFQAGRTGKSAPAVLNGANEIAVAAFLKEQIVFMDIPALVGWVVEQHNPVEIESFAHLLEIDRWARNQAELFVKNHKK